MIEPNIISDAATFELSPMEDVKVYFRIRKGYPLELVHSDIRPMLYSWEDRLQEMQECRSQPIRIAMRIADGPHKRSL